MRDMYCCICRKIMKYSQPPNRSSIFFISVCENTCRIDLSVTANLASSFESPFVIGSSSFVTLVFTVVNLGADPAYIPILKIPLGSRKILKTPGNCKRIVSIRPSNQSWQILRIIQAYIQRTCLRLETAFRGQGSKLYLRSMQELIVGVGQTRFLLGLTNIQLLGSA